MTITQPKDKPQRVVLDIADSVPAAPKHVQAASTTADQDLVTSATQDSAYAKTFANIIGDTTDLHYFNKCSKYFINLNSRADRLVQTLEQVGDTFTRFPAIEGKELGYKKLNSYFNTKKCHAVYRIWQSLEQASATLSHYGVYKQTLEGKTRAQDHEWTLVAEDDNCYVVDFARKLDQLLQFLEDPRFDHVEIVVLKAMEIKETFDYVNYICDFDARAGRTLVKHCEEQLRSRDDFNEAQYQLACNYFFSGFFPTTRDRVFEFSYKDVKPSPTPELYDERQHLFYPTYFRPYSASLYLIRNRLCRKVVRKYRRPFWYADDFKQFVAPQCIMYASPFLAHEPEQTSHSSITNELAEHNWYFNRLMRNRDFYRNKMLKKYDFFTKWMYGTDRRKQRASILMQRLLWLYY